MTVFPLTGREAPIGDLRARRAQRREVRRRRRALLRSVRSFMASR